jgi:hypothetical protein
MPVGKNFAGLASPYLLFKTTSEALLAIGLGDSECFGMRGPTEHPFVAFIWLRRLSDGCAEFRD